MIRPAPPWLESFSRAALLVILTWCLGAPSTTLAVEPDQPLYDRDGRLVGMTTDEPELYFLIPSRWTLPTLSTVHQMGVTPVVDAGGQVWYDLRLVLTPDYSAAASTVLALRAAEPYASFFPLPLTVQRVTLFLPDALGSIESELTPDQDGFDTPVAMYYRLRFSPAQLSSLRGAARSGLALQGAVEYEYPASSGVEETAAPLTIILSEQALAERTDEPAPEAWLANLLSSTHVRVQRPIDGAYALGGSVRVAITDSVIEARFISATWDLDSDGSVFRLVPAAASNLTGQLRFRVPALGFSVEAEISVALSARLDLSSMSVHIDGLDLTSVQINGVSSSFYRSLLRKMFDSPAVRARLSQALSEELQERILEQTLFGLEDVW